MLGTRRSALHRASRRETSRPSIAVGPYAKIPASRYMVVGPRPIEQAKQLASALVIGRNIKLGIAELRPLRQVQQHLRHTHQRRQAARFIVQQHDARHYLQKAPRGVRALPCDGRETVNGERSPIQIVLPPARQRHGVVPNEKKPASAGFLVRAPGIRRRRSAQRLPAGPASP